jgi:hypothetical protein
MNRQASGQATRSTDADSSTCPNSSGNVAPAVAHAQSAWARRSPPASRVISASTTTVATADSVAGMRNAQGSSARPVISRASSGVSGG